MTETYNKLENLYRKYHPAQFSMAIAQLMEMGFHDAAEITNEEIDKAEGNALMTKEFWQDTLRLVREIAQEYKPTEFMQFCEVTEPLNVRYFSDHPTRRDLEKYVDNAICVLEYKGMSEEEIIDELGIEDDASFWELGEEEDE